MNFLRSIGAPGYRYAKYYLYNINYVRKTMCLATILSVQYKFHNHWSDGKHNAEVRTVN